MPSMKRTTSPGRFGSSNLLMALLAVSSLLSCVDASLDPDDVSASVISAGEYATDKGIPTFAEQRTKIPCEVGRMFGIDYELAVAGGGPGLIPVDFEWIHPPLPVEGSTRTGTATKGGVPNPSMGRGEKTLMGRSLWSIEHADERVSGIYRLEIRTIGARRLVLSQDFEVEGC